MSMTPTPPPLAPSPPPLSARPAWWNLLLLIPFVALLWVPLYNRIEPTVFGIPFFYWYQFLWVILTTLVILIVDSRTSAADTADGTPAPGPRDPP